MASGYHGEIDPYDDYEQMGYASGYGRPPDEESYRAALRCLARILAQPHQAGDLGPACPTAGAWGLPDQAKHD